MKSYETSMILKLFFVYKPWNNMQSCQWANGLKWTNALGQNVLSFFLIRDSRFLEPWFKLMKCQVMKLKIDPRVLSIRNTWT